MSMTAKKCTLSASQLVGLVLLMLAAACGSSSSGSSGKGTNEASGSVAATDSTRSSDTTRRRSSATTAPATTSTLAPATYGCSDLAADTAIFVAHLEAALGEHDDLSTQPGFAEKVTPLIGAVMTQCGVPWAMSMAGERPGPERRAIEAIIIATAPTTSAVTPPPTPAPAPTPAPPAPSLALTSFASPSGNIGCLVNPDGVRCDIRDRLWEGPTDENCPLDYGDALTLDATGTGWECHGDTVLGSPNVLPYGASTRQGEYVCESKTSGVTCRSLNTGHGFTVARELYETF